MKSKLHWTEEFGIAVEDFKKEVYKALKILQMVEWINKKL